ncbi:D-glycero-alpha-D-manno-heptose-1,7-bisphosphate 7-phosphatase [Pseudalkalibacillus salsuginis]|uniref:D-glycero-alpha-D-manno-heptose-1,7-bisphosphate 7-phosphatase n=1 Tax=Pseudalkalibacillus salsuginis TaxID=2910972 RepID=UPI001F2999E2|nr:HAD-IIIA family hydrolase [Pseudalkalibacillus salsuginis]MCF6411271.1 HAD-IIIA family hydrolase [Pseudalkalibacillus salsuginis]
MKVAFFDRDGTIIRDYPDHEWSKIHTPEFIDGSIETMKEVQDRGYEIIIITNQYLINERIITKKQYENITNEMLKVLKDSGVFVLDIFFCPHSRSEGFSCIKPNQGMIDQATTSYPSIDLKSSIIIGDSECDMELACTVGIKGYWITEDNSEELREITQIQNITEVLRYM